MFGKKKKRYVELMTMFLMYYPNGWSQAKKDFPILLEVTKLSYFKNQSAEESAISSLVGVFQGEIDKLSDNERTSYWKELNAVDWDNAFHEFTEFLQHRNTKPLADLPQFCRTLGGFYFSVLVQATLNKIDQPRFTRFMLEVDSAFKRKSIHYYTSGSYETCFGTIELQ